MYRPREFSKVKIFLSEKSGVCYKEAQEKPKHCSCDYTTHFCRTTSNHGFAHLVDPNECVCVKLVWALVIFIFACIVTAMIYFSVLSLVNPSLTTEFVEEMDYNGNHSFLPDIHICDTSVFNATRLKKMGFNDTMATYLTLATSDNAARHLTNDESKALKEELGLNLKEELESILTATSRTMEVVIRNAAIRCEEIVYGCSHAGEFFHKRECCRTYFPSPPFVSIFGSCISTKGETVRQSYESRDAGFIVYVTPNVLDIIKFDSSIIKMEYILPKGLYYAVSSSAVHLQSVLQKNGRFAALNSWNSIPITKTKIDNAELKDNPFAPYTCIDETDSTSIKKIIPGYKHYSQQNCYLEFWQNIYRKYSNCLAVFYRHDNNSQLCKPHDIITANYSLQVPHPEGCPVACIEEFFEVSPSSAYFNNDSFMKSFPGVNPNKHELVSLHFFYNTFRYQVRKIHTNTFLQWLGEIGGNLGLFLGASLISLLEIVLVFIRCCVKRSL